MKYLVSCLLALPLLTSCVEQDPYYEHNYYAPPPPRVEVERHDLEHHHNNGHYRPAPQGRVYQGHNNVHGHGNVNGGSRVIVNSHNPQGQVQVQQNTHGHGGANNNAARPRPTGKPVVVPGAARGQTNNVQGQAQQPAQSQDETQQATHGHN
ncbi:hypothetical protein [Legionella fallonii]|uniref:Uncharacterized protein n=1 Tax=Legionella fallonii LLAP-10 TaxID=1212491 RepID=A0A098G4V6_9GAMM|nr:hypothetical protein [Legionella fallonii]CEG57497.1 conserved exported protein of unknown function [Legionella fallonii LLAP-10]